MTAIRSPRRTTRRLVGTTVALLTAVALAQAQTATSTTSSAPAKAHVAKASRASRPAAQSLDLHAPPLNHLYSASQLRYMMAYDPDDMSDSEVSVKGNKAVVNVPVTPGNQLMAVPWALLHPTQAWRIFTPVENP